MKAFLTISLLAVCCASFVVAEEPVRTVDWVFTSLEMVGGHMTTLLGSPRLIDAPQGNAVEFDGQSGLFLDVNPLAGLKQFTAEVVFQPYAAGAKEPRFLHFQEAGG